MIENKSFEKIQSEFYDENADEIIRIKNREADKYYYGKHNENGFKKYRAGNNSQRPKPRKKKR